MRFSLLAGTLACAALLHSQPPQSAAVEKLRAAFAHPPDDCRIMMRWWWFGPAVDKSELERELRAMKDGGIGGVEIQPVYPVTLDDPARGLTNLPYLSDGFLDAVRFANDKARELGLRVDITLGSGWPYGGPHTPVGLASAKLRVERLTAAATLPLPKIGGGEKFVAAFLSRGTAFDRIVNVDGAGLHLPSDAPAGAAVLVFIASRTHQAVKRAAVGAEGPVLDHYSAAAIANHLHFVGDRLLEAFGAHPSLCRFQRQPGSLAGADWTAGFLGRVSEAPRL
jgi:hypothetical protein